MKKCLVKFVKVCNAFIMVGVDCIKCFSKKLTGDINEVSMVDPVTTPAINSSGFYIL